MWIIATNLFECRKHLDRMHQMWWCQRIWAYQQLFEKNIKNQSGNVRECIMEASKCKMRERSQAILLKEWPLFHPHETLNLNVEVAHFHKHHQPTIFFAMKWQEMVLTVPFCNSIAFLRWAKGHFSLVHSLPLHVKAMHTFLGMSLGKTSLAFMSGVWR